jgi:hypothetical protein
MPTPVRSRTTTPAATVQTILFFHTPKQ